MKRMNPLKYKFTDKLDTTVYFPSHTIWDWSVLLKILSALDAL